MRKSVLLTILAVSLLALLASCSKAPPEPTLGPYNNCNDNEARLRLKAEAFDSCEARNNCTITADNIAKLFDELYHHVQVCGKLK